MKCRARSEPRNARELINLPGIATGSDGEPLASREFVTILIKPRRNDGGTANVIVRGLDKIGRELRPDFKIVEGRDLESGVNEIITSRSFAKRFEGLGLGESIQVNNVDFTVVGHFEAGGSSAESEVWADLRDITAAQRYVGAVSVINMRVPNAADRQAIIDRVRDDDQFKLDAISETEYFENQKQSSVAIKVIAYLIAGFLTIGAMFAASNTMYAAVSSRSREIGALRAIGFPRRSILFSFMMESLVICVLGADLGLPGDHSTQRNFRWYSTRVQRDYVLISIRPQSLDARNGAGGSNGFVRRSVSGDSRHSVANYGRLANRLNWPDGAVVRNVRLIDG